MDKPTSEREAGRMYLPFYRSLAFKVGIGVGLIALIATIAFAYFSVDTQRNELMRRMRVETLRLSETVANSMKHSMQLYDVEGIDRIVQGVGLQKGISRIRVLNHEGAVRFSSQARELGRKVDQGAATCRACHGEEKPIQELNVENRTRIFQSPGGERALGMITPIYNERSCFSAACHVHSETDRVLGVLDMAVGLGETEQQLAAITRKTLYVALAVFAGIAGLLILTMVRSIRNPLRTMMEAADRASRGEDGWHIERRPRDELGELAESLNRISERMKEHEGQLDHTREEFKALFENVPTYVAVLDRDYRIVQANRNFKYTFGDRVGEKCFQAYKRLESRCRECPVEKTFKELKPQQSEERGRTIEGEEIHYLVYTAPVLDGRGEPIYAIEMSVDLRETKRLEEELKASREFLNNLIENSIHGIVAVDAAGRVIVFNRSAERILGYQASEAMGSHDLERFFPRVFTRSILAALGSRPEDEALKTTTRETWLRSKGGERIPVRFSGVILVEDQATVGAVGFFQDLTGFKALEREKLQAEKLAAVGQTVAGLAHGVKNILTGLDGGVYVVETAMKRRDDSLLQKGWGMVERNIEKISSLVKDLLSYSKERLPELQWMDPNELSEEVFGLYQEKARQAGIELSLEADPNMGRAQLDPKGMHSCLTNLLSNAVDACLYDLEQEEAHQVIMRTRREVDESVTFEVEDNGMGIADEVKEKLFTSLFSTKGTGGTGLGLLVTHKIVQEHGGRITVDTEPGRGSCFRITIPQEETQAPNEPEGESAANNV